MRNNVEIERWENCYEDSWDGFIVPDAFAHPAKYARGLITRIFMEMRALGMLQKRDTIVDPFGGIATGGIVAAGLGLRWFGCELEPKFHKLGNENIEMHRALWERFGDPVPVLVNGDSRKLRENLAGVIPQAVVCSPPFSTPGCQPPTNRTSEAPVRSRLAATCPGGSYDESATPGQLGAMPMGDVAAVVSSPPYAESLRGDNSERETADSRAKRLTEGGSLGQSCRHSGYGGPGNLGNLPSGEVEAVVTSPPFEQSDSRGAAKMPDGYFVRANGQPFGEGAATRNTIGESPGQLGNEQGETFWSAARDIVQECHAILKPGGWSAWVVKDFIRNKQRVPFCDDWCRLLEACGFVVTKRVHAMLVKEDRHPDLFGGDDHVKTTARKSFFRRIYEKKYPENSIDFEQVVFARKPQ